MFRSPVAALPARPAADWREALRAALRGGDRLVTLFGRPAEGDGVILTAVLQRPDGSLEVLRGAAERAHGYHTLTREFPAAHCFERELHEQLGLRLADHPWLKPVRFEGANLGKTGEYRYYKLQGKDVHEVAVGPVHAGVIEPGSFRFMCLGETVHHLEIQLGYQHRAVETLLLRGDPRRQAPIAETVAGDTTVAHAWAYCAALESLAGLEADPDVECSRAFGLELERVAMHLSGLAGLCADIGFLQGATSYGRLRTTAINTSMRLCGSRFGRGWLRPGGAQAVMDAQARVEVDAAVALLVRDLAVINDRFQDAVTVRHRFQRVGTLSTRQALDLGLVGMAARSAGVSLDQRSLRLGAFGRFPVPAATEKEGDCWARAVLRIRETDASLRFLAAVLAAETPFTAVRRPIGGLAPGELAVSVCEGWRGEVVHCLETDSLGRLLHYKVQDPSLRNWFGLAMAVRGGDISDFPICNKSFDLSYCGNDL